MATNLEKMQKIARAEKKSGEPKKRSSRSNQTVKDFNFNVYVYKVLKQVHPDTGISGDAKACMVNLVKINVAKIMNAANQLVLRSGVRTISSRDIQSAVRIVLPGELAKHAVSEGTKAVTKYNASISEDGKKGDGKPILKSVRAGLTFNVTRIEKLMMLESTTARKSAGAAVYLTAVAEYLAAEVLELSGNSARDNKRIRITARNIKLAILNDEELNRLYFDTVIAGGVVPRIESALLLPAKEDKPKRPKKTASVTEVKDAKPKKTASKTIPKKAAPTLKKAASKASPKKPAKPAKKVATKPKKVAISKTAKK